MGVQNKSLMLVVIMVKCRCRRYGLFWCGSGSVFSLNADLDTGLTVLQKNIVMSFCRILSTL